MINPLHTSLFRKSLSLRKTKTDKVDSKTIATMLMSDVDLKPYSNELYHNEELKSLSRYRFDKVQERAKLKSSIARLVNILFPELEKLFCSIHLATVYQLVINNGKLLTLLMKNKTSYCLPGGHVELGEDSRSAMIREMEEEIDTSVTIDKELAIVENFYTDKNNFNTHEISYYYTVIPKDWNKIPFTDYTKTENDKGEIKEHNFVWLDLNNISNYDLRPNYLKEKLQKSNYDFEHLIIKE